MANILRYLTIAIIAVICYAVSLYGSFVFDDSEAIVKNKDVMPFTPIFNVFKNDFWGTDIALNSSHKSYRPITILTYRLNVLLSNSKIDAFQFHAVNIILYAVLCVLIIPTVETLLSKRKRNEFITHTAFLTSLLFAVHPVHTESIAALVGRADILSSILYLIALMLYQKLVVRKSFFILVVILIIFLAVLCKETAIMAIAQCVMYEILQNNAKNGKSLIKSVTIGSTKFNRIIVLVTSGLLILLFRFYIMNFEGPIFTKSDNPGAFAEHISSRLFTYNYIYFLNALLLLWPQWLCFDWSMGCIPIIESICDFRVIFVFILWISVIYSAYKLFKSFIDMKKADPRFMGICLTILPFVPAANIFMKVGFVIAERTLLLPSVGYCFLVVYGFKKLVNFYKGNQKVYNGYFYILCIILSLRTIQRNVDWLTEEKLFSSALQVCPLNAKVHYNVAKVAADKGDKALALEEYRKAIKLNPEYEQAMNNLANLLRDDKHFDEAEKLLRKAVEVRPNFAAAWMNLGIVLTNLNKSEEAEYCYLTAIFHRNKYPDCYYNLGNLYLDLKRNEEALKAWQMAVSYRPTHTAAWSNTLVLLDSMRKYDDVLDLGQTALFHNPTSPALHFSIANTLGKLQQFEKAEKHFLEALNLSSNNALYYSNLGVLYHRWGKKDKAMDMYKKALQINPHMTTTENNLKKLMNLTQ